MATRHVRFARTVDPYGGPSVLVFHDGTLIVGLGQAADLTDDEIASHPEVVFREIDESVPASVSMPTSVSTAVVDQGGLSAYDIWLSEGNRGTIADFLASLEGERGPVGPSSSPFIHEQTNPSEIWNVTHPLGREPAAVAVEDLNGVRIWAQVVSDEQQVTVSFSEPISGRVIVL